MSERNQTVINKIKQFIRFQYFLIAGKEVHLRNGDSMSNEEDMGIKEKIVINFIVYLISLEPV
jgi:hypothetical protein